MSWKGLLITICLGVLMACAGAGAAPAPPPRYDVLIVIDSRKPAQVKEEHDLRLQLEKSRVLHNLDSRDLPVDTYDVAKEGQRQAVEHLKIPDWQLPFLGLAELGGKDNIPVKVQFGGGPVDKIEQSVGATMAEAFKRLGKTGLVLPSATPSPTASASPAASTPAVQGQSVSVVIVVNGPRQQGLGNRLLAAAEQARREAGLTLHQLPIHIFRTLRETPFMTSHGVTALDTPVIAVVSVRDHRAFTGVRYRLVNVNDPVRAAHDVVTHAVGMMQEP